MKIERSEHKYFISEYEVDRLIECLKSVLYVDKNCTNSEPYTITSFYFDDYEDSHFMEKLQGINFREKFRIRFYNSDPSYPSFEVKRKKHSYIEKSSLRLDYSEAQKILSGDFSVLDKSPDFEYLCYYMRDHKFKPKSVVKYERMAFYLPFDNIRITFDLNLRGSTNFSISDLNDFKVNKFFMPLNYQILELKYYGELPPFLKKILSTSSLNQSSISKYVLSRIDNNTQLWEDRGELPY
jgi:hypothetical protein